MGAPLPWGKRERACRVARAVVGGNPHGREGEGESGE